MESEMRKIKIVYFAGRMKSDQDGVTRVLFRLAEWLNKNRIEIYLFQQLYLQQKTYQ